MKYKLLYIILIPILFSSCLKDNTSVIADLSGDWILTENIYSKIDYSDNQKKIKLPGSWIDINNKNIDFASLITIKKNVIIPQKYRGRLLTLSLGNIAISDETYFNGVKIGATGKIPNNDNRLNYDFTWLHKRGYSIPENLIKYDEENEIKIKIFSHIFNGITGTMAIEDTLKMNKNIHLKNNLFTLDIKTIIINIILGIFFIIILEALKKRKIICYSIIILGIITVIHLNFIGVGYENGLTRYKIILSLLSIAYYYFTLSVQDFFEKTVKYSHPILLTMLIITEILVIFAPNSSFLIYISGSATMIYNIILTTYYSAIVIISTLKNLKRYWMFLIMAIPLITNSIQFHSSLFSLEFNKITLAYFFHLSLVLVILLIVLLIDFVNIYSEKNILDNVLILKNRIIRQTKRKLKNNQKEVPGEIIQEIITYLDKNFKDRYNRKELAKTFNLNEDYIGHKFKKKTGITISNYINKKRIIASKDLLINSDSKIIDIAYHIGFESLVHFHREFKKNTGMTPKNYRLKNSNIEKILEEENGK